MGIDKDSLYLALGKRIRRHREEAKLSQERLSRGLNVSRTSIVNIEAGRQHPPLHTLWRIAEVLNVEPAALLPEPAEFRTPGFTAELSDRERKEIEEAAQGDERVLEALLRAVPLVKRKLGEAEP